MAIIALSLPKLMFVYGDDAAESATEKSASVQKLLSAAQVSMAKKNAKEALATIEKAIQIDPTDAAPIEFRGVIYQMQGDVNKAVADFTQALKLNPKSMTAYYNRGTLLATAGKTDQAIVDFTAAMLLEPKVALLYYNRGRALFEKGELEKPPPTIPSAFASIQKMRWLTTIAARSTD